ncbi:MAG: hypothetical protein H8D78_03235 [Chloroflexi bacterium]|nr:hypothetical protein [Chloroflexota bacterium]
MGPEEAERALQATGYEVKPTLVMLLAGVEEARRRLRQAAAACPQLSDAAQDNECRLNDGECPDLASVLPS